MPRILLPLTLMIVCCALTPAQNTNPQCPTISVAGPAGSFLPGETIVFTVSLKNAEQFKPKFYWTVENGEIESGQGTTKLVVRVNPENKWEAKEKATVQIEGLPVGCPNTASEQAITVIDRRATMLDIMGGALSSIEDDRFKSIADALRNEPNAQLYVFVPPDKQIRSALYERLSTFIPRLGDPARVTYVDNETLKSSAEFWIVYPSTTPPTRCQSCEAEPFLRVCPAISVTGPAGVSRLGTTMTFAASAPEDYKGTYKWTVDAGNIESELGKPWIIVRVPTEAYTPSITATVELSGLPAGCPNSASEKGVVDPGGHPREADNYDRLPISKEKERLRNIAVEMASNPGSTAVFLISVPNSSKTAFESRKRFISSYLTSIKIVEERTRFVLGDRDRYNTSIYIFPAGVEIPFRKK